MFMIARAVSFLTIIPACIAKLELEGRYSVFSGIVVDAELGGQRLRVALDFNSRYSTFHSESTCPMFVDSCYDGSTAQIDRGHVWSVHGGREQGNPAVDTLTIGGSEMKNFRFILRSKWNPMYMEFIEVGGVVGMRRNTHFLRNRVLSIRDTSCTSFGFELKALKNTLHPPLLDSFRFVPTVDDAWAFRASFSSGDAEIVSDAMVKYDPGMESLIIPLRYKERFLDSLPMFYEEDREGNLYLVCYPGALNLAFSSPSTGLIRIASDQLFDRTTPSPYTILCKTRIVFREEDVIVIGRILTRSTSRIILDYREGRIGFGRFDDSRIPFENAHALVPLFSDPVVSNGRISFAWSDSKQRGLVLLDRDPSVQRVDSEETTVYKFHRTDFDETNVGEQLVSINAQSVMMGEYPNGGLELRITEGGIKSVTVIREQLTVLVIIKSKIKRRSIRSLALPPRTVAGEQRESQSCAICMEEYVVGQCQQKLSNCDHKFHYECIKNWLEYGTATCPECRKAVEFDPSYNRV